MRRRVFLALFLTAACSTDTFSGDDGAVSDSSNEINVIEGGNADASLDALPPTDGGFGDAGDATITTPFSCSSPPTGSIFCDDFDNVLTAATGWATTFTSNGGAVALDTSFSVSPLKSLLTTIQSGPGAAASAALFFQDNNATYATMSARMSVRVHYVDVAQTIPILQLTYDSTTTMLALSGNAVVVRYPNALTDGGIATTSIGYTYTPGSWFDVRVDMKPGTSGKISVYIGNVLAKTITPSWPAPLSALRSVELGLEAETGSTELEVNFDDFDYAGL